MLGVLLSPHRLVQGVADGTNVVPPLQVLVACSVVVVAVRLNAISVPHVLEVLAVTARLPKAPRRRAAFSTPSKARTPVALRKAATLAPTSSLEGIPSAVAPRALGIETAPLAPSDRRLAEGVALALAAGTPRLAVPDPRRSSVGLEASTGTSAAAGPEVPSLRLAEGRIDALRP